MYINVPPSVQLFTAGSGIWIEAEWELSTAKSFHCAATVRSVLTSTNKLF